MDNLFNNAQTLNDLNAAAGAAPINPVPPTPADTKQAPAGQIDLVTEGKEYIKTWSEDDKANLSANSGKVHFIKLLGDNARPSKRLMTAAEWQASKGNIPMYEQDGSGKRTPKKDAYTPCPTVVGLELKTDIDLEFPEIPVIKAPHDLRKANLDFSKFNTRKVKAGETFVVSRVEALYLLSMPEYKLNSYISAVDKNGQTHERGLQLVCKASKLNAVTTDKTAAALPTPAFKFVDENSFNPIKAAITPIITKDANGNITCVPEYATKFGALCEAKVTSAPSSKTAVKDSQLSSLGVAKLFGALTGLSK